MVVFPPLTNQVLVFFCSDQVDLWPIIFPFHTCQLSLPVRLTLKVTKSSETHIISSNRILEVSSFFLLRVLLLLLLRQIIGWAPLGGQGVTSENRSCIKIKCQCFRIKYSLKLEKRKGELFCRSVGSPSKWTWHFPDGFDLLRNFEMGNKASVYPQS